MTMIRQLKKAFIFSVFLSTSVSAQTQSNWKMSVVKDAMTDETNATASLYSENGDKLLFACNGIVEPTLSVQYLPKKYLGSTENLVTIRFDQDPPLPSVSWEFVGKGAYSTSVSLVDWFSRQVGDGERNIRIRALDFRDQPIDALFVSQDGKSAINLVRAACGENEI